MSLPLVQHRRNRSPQSCRSVSIVPTRTSTKMFMTFAATAAAAAVVVSLLLLLLCTTGSGVRVMVVNAYIASTPTTGTTITTIPSNTFFGRPTQQQQQRRPRRHGGGAYGGNVIQPPPPPQQQQQGPSTVVLHMNLFDRFQRVAKSNLNNLLQGLEDPEKIMTQALEDMQTDLVKIRQSYAEVTATQRRLLKQKEQADAVAMDWYKRAQLALEKGNDVLAKEALTRRQMAVDEATTLQSQITLQTTSIDKLYEGMQILEKKILEAKSKKEQMVARARTAQASQKVNDLVSGVTGKTSMDAFKRMEDKVEALEAAAEVSAEMGMMGALSAGSDVEQQFKLLEASTSVDDELAKMKQNLLSGSSSSSSGSASSSSSSTSSSGGGLDDELERLKREAGL